MINAIDAAINSIFASSLTTVVGFLALVSMKFTIGFDMGLVLAKGIVFSLITVLFFMPAYDSQISRWMIRPGTVLPALLPEIQRMGLQGALRIPYHYADSGAARLCTQGMNDFLYGNSAVGASEGTQVYADDQVISREFGRSNMMLAMYPNTSAVTEKEMSDEIEDLPYVKSVTSMSNTLPEGIPEEFLPYSVTSELHTKDYCRMLIYIRTKTESDQAFKGADEIRDILERYYPENSYLVGETPSTQDIKTTITADNSRVNLLSMLGVFLVVMFSFRSFAIPMIVMVPIEAAISSIWPCLPGRGYHGVYGVHHSEQHPAGSHGGLFHSAHQQLCVLQKVPGEEGSVYSGADAVLSLYFYFGNHYHIGWSISFISYQPQRL